MFYRAVSAMVLLMILLAGAVVPAGGEPNNVQVNPEDIRIGLYYSGSTVR